ncbi:unnamed protein product [Dicrocoelium dendriticum]|nr:unnamed protein product [Dicrocoelium dendriticum]
MSVIMVDESATEIPTPDTVLKQPSPPNNDFPSPDEIKKLYYSMSSSDGKGLLLTNISKALQLLGQCPTQASIQAICESYTPDEQAKNVVPSVKLEQFTDILKENWLSKSGRIAQLNDAFRFFDKDESGVIEANILREKLLTVGDCFTEKEANEFFNEAKPTADGKLPYDSFVQRLVEPYSRPKSKRETSGPNQKKGGTARK